MRLFALALIASLFAAPVLAHGPQEVQVKAHLLGSHVSEPGETKEMFVLRVAAEMQRWTDLTGNEACGVLATDGQRWGVSLTTQQAQVLCFFAREVVPAGMTATGENIHSHPTPDKGHLRITAETRQVLRDVGDRVLLKRVKDANGGRLRVEVEGFSTDDYAAGPGYLVVNGRLYFQAGRGTQREVGQVASTAMASR